MLENPNANSVMDLRNFFNTAEKPCKTAEMMEFWKSLAPEEKAYYQNADLSE